MVNDFKTIQYKGKIVFAKAIFKDFKRELKYFSADESCFMFLKKGCFNLRTPDKVIMFEEGDGMLAKCGNYFVEHSKGSDSDLEVVAAYFHPSIVKPFFPGELSLTNFRPDYDATPFPMDEMLRIFMESIIFLLDNPTACSEEMALLKLKELLLLLAKTDQVPSIHAFIASLFKPYEYDFRETVLRNSTANLSLPELALLCNMSLATFKRRFSTVFGESPAQFMVQAKLEKASRQLSEQPDARISDVAYDCGFDTVTHFNKVFKKQFGISPTEFKLSQNANPLSH
ncbi:MAG: helix-turn-helix domain-containing protein [Bacteroidetes bacterium]|nr:helix-turn-helix domain-containing protein [Bacteroidota bacterium]